ncbi:hypothetical protein [Sphingomonas koreensis]
MIERSSPFPASSGSLPARGERESENEVLPFVERIARASPEARLPVLADGSPPPENAHPIPDQARVFNEDGFFATAQAVTAEAVALRFAALAAPVEEVHAVAGLPPPGSDAQLPGVRSANPGLDVPNAPGRRPVPLLAEVAISPASGGQPAGAALEPPVELVEFASSVEAELVPASMANAPSHRAGAQSTLRIAIRDIERGLQILVATQALSPEERERLTHEIAALLSRHGLVPRDVRIAGPVRVDSSGRS